MKDNLEQKRKKNSEREKNLASSEMFQRYIKQQREKIAVQESTEHLLDMQYNSDQIMILKLLMDWMDKSKTEKQKSVLSKTIVSLTRITSYVTNLQVVSKSSVVSMLDLKKENRKLKNQMDEMKKKMEIMKREIQHYEDENR